MTGTEVGGIMAISVMTIEMNAAGVRSYLRLRSFKPCPFLPVGTSLQSLRISPVSLSLENYVSK